MTFNRKLFATLHVPPKTKSWRHQQAKDMERLHPQSWRELRQLVLLHGAKAIQRAIQHIEEEF